MKCSTLLRRTLTISFVALFFFMNSASWPYTALLAAPPDLEVLEINSKPEKLDPTRFIITWKTNRAASGWIMYGADNLTVNQIAYDVMGRAYRGTAHRVAISDLKPDTKYYFIIYGNKKRFDKKGNFYSFTTKSDLTIQPTAQPTRVTDEPAGAPNREKKETFRTRLRAKVKSALKSAPMELNAVRLPINVRLLKLKFIKNQLTLNLSREAIAEGKDAAFEELLSYLNSEINTLFDQEGKGEERAFNYEIFIEGEPLYESSSSTSIKENVSGIGGQKIILSPGHGRYDNGSNGWPFQRGTYNSIIEDRMTIDLVSDFAPKLASVGADLRLTRQLNKNAGNHYSGYPWWEMDASEYVRSLGAPDSVWQNGFSGIDRDIRSRPLYGNWVGANTMVSIHTNGGGGCGTETWYDTGNGYQTQSADLANRIQAKIIERVRAQYNSNWCNRGVKGSNGGYGENRIFKGAAVIVEVAYHDNVSDANALKNATFRAIVGTAIKDALAEYYGGTSGCTTIPSNQYCAQYYNNRVLSGSPTFTRNESSINNDWGNSGPGNGIGSDNFSVRWQGAFNFNAATYTFTTTSDDGIRLWVDGSILIDRWIDQGATTYTASRSMSAGNHTVKVEYYENGGGAVAKAGWSQAGSSLINGNFESGRNVGWSEYSSKGYAIVKTGFPHSGSWSTYYCEYDNCTEYISQQIKYTSNQRLTFWWYMRSKEGTSTAFDYLQVQVLSTSGTLLTTLVSINNTNSRNGWVQTTAVLPSSYTGQNVILRFKATTDSSLTTAFYVDDVSIQ